MTKRTKSQSLAPPSSDNDIDSHGSSGKKQRKEEAKERTGERQYWLMKAEPESRMVKGQDVKFSIDDLAAMPNQTSQWDGVRNYEARNLMRDRMKVGDGVLFYHSNCKCPGVAGIAKVVREGYPDFTAFDPEHPYFDPKWTDRENPRWYMVDVRLVQKLDRLVPLAELKQYTGKGQPLDAMVLLRRGRLSVQPVSQQEFDWIQELGQTSPPSSS